MLLARLLWELARLRLQLQQQLLLLGRRWGLSVGLLRVIHGLAIEGLGNLLVGHGSEGARRRLLVSPRGRRQRRIGTERLRSVSHRRAWLWLLLG